MGRAKEMEAKRRVVPDRFSAQLSLLSQKSQFWREIAPPIATELNLSTFHLHEAHLPRHHHRILFKPQ